MTNPLILCLLPEPWDYLVVILCFFLINWC